MTAEPPQGLVTEAVRTLEVRWIFPGQLEAAVAGWFGRFPTRMESREDTYLLDPRLPGLSVKIRGGSALGQDWWTLGFEATGPADLVRSALEATAALVFTEALPGGVEPSPDDSRSYAQWLGQRPGADNDAGA